ncbi:fasciclin-2 isoform X2 [Euwallacea fornicatus]|uniref:fasciclin-2 isoform X2 n=1 Tax=Euwallacea fornicatus TaxID=995702 RepID=UPI00339064D0
MCSALVWLLLWISGITAITAQSPSLEIQPRSRPIRKEVGENLVLTCRPNVPKPDLITNLEWRNKNDKRIETSYRSSPLYIQDVPGDVGIMLVFTGLTAQQAGNYSCHASYTNTEHLSASVEVSTFKDVQFTDAPESQYSKVGSKFTIKCIVKGDPYPIIDWYKGDELIAENTEKYIKRTDGLFISNVTEADDGVYKCSALVPSTGVYKTRNIKVEVHVPPKIFPMNPIEVVEGETASVQCTAIGKPPPTYQWIKLDHRNDLSKTDRFDVKKLTGELIMNRVEFGDDGMYKCAAENPAGTVDTEVRISVLVKPQIYELLNATTPVGNESRLLCKTKGRPPPKVTFRKLGSSTPFTVGKQITDTRITLKQEIFKNAGEAFGTLIINNLTRSDDGLYECIAENPTGAAYKNGHITVWFKPTFNRTRDLPPVWSWDGRPGNLSCLPEAIPNATIVWRWNQFEISEENFKNKLIFRENFQVIGKSPQSFLIVKPYNTQKYYTFYECLATNALGDDSIKIQLKQGSVPLAISQIRANTVTATTIKFSIVPQSNYDGLPIRSYTVQYKPERQPVWEKSLTHTWSTGAPYILENLFAEETYHFRFAARNDVGLGPWTNGPTITMPRRSAPAEPTILVPGVVNLTETKEFSAPYSNHFEIRWNVPADNGEPIEHYLIRFCQVNHIEGVEEDIKCSENIQQSVQYTNFPLNDLIPDTSYKVELRAVNAMGASSPATIRFRTARGIGPVPLNSASMSSGLIVGLVVAGLVAFLIMVDLICFCLYRTGVIALCCDRARRKKKDEEDPKLGSYKAAPAHPNSLNLPQPIKLAGTPLEEKEPLNQPAEKPVSVEFDGRQVYTKPGEIIGKHSAV